MDWKKIFKFFFGEKAFDSKGKIKKAYVEKLRKRVENKNTKKQLDFILFLKNKKKKRK
jgi:hypothetical protein